MPVLNKKNNNKDKGLLERIFRTLGPPQKTNDIIDNKKIIKVIWSIKECQQ